MQDLDPSIVELEPCAPPQATALLREVAFRANAWLPAEVAQLAGLLAAVGARDDTAAPLGRGRAGVADKIATLGLRRNSVRPWSELEDEERARPYGGEATAALAAAFGRSCSAVYARAGALGLAEAGAPQWTPWEDTQLRAGYARGVPLLQLAALIGRPFSGLASRASTLGVTHALHPPDWSEAEAGRALELAAEGHRYIKIVAMLAAEGFPPRTTSGFGQIVRKLGYGRGWGRAWTGDEDELLRRAYRQAASLTPLRARLGRTSCSIRWRAEYLGLRGTHGNRNGWRLGADWTEAQIATLRAEYGRTANVTLAAKLGRTKAAMFTRANVLGLVHGYIRPFAPDELRALDLAFDHGVAIADLAAALGRKPCSVSKFATNHGYRFGRRPRAGQEPTLAALLDLGAAPEAVAGVDPAADTCRAIEKPDLATRHTGRGKSARQARCPGRRRRKLLRHEQRRFDRLPRRFR